VALGGLGSPGFFSPHETPTAIIAAHGVFVGEMAGSVLDSGGGRDELKTQFMTREGTYHLMTLAEYSRPNRVGYANQAASCNAPVKVSFVNSGSGEQGGEKIAFNYGRELFVYPYRGVRKAADLTKPVDKRVYKGTCPTCHDFGPPGCLKSEPPEVIPLLVGFSGGQIQLIDPNRKELSRLYNEERLVDKSRVSCLKWAPGRQDTFLVAHASGQLYTYQAELECGSLPPVYQQQKQGEGFTVYSAKGKAVRNPTTRCSVGAGPINEFVFSPCGAYLALVSQDGMLRVLHWDTMELVGQARSYFGGLLCVCWSPDGKYIVCGGEDDLVTVYSFHERRVVVRGQGHRSWVSVVSFDVQTLAYDEVPDGLDFSGSDDEGTATAAPPGPATINSPPPAHRPLEGVARQASVRGRAPTPPTSPPALASPPEGRAAHPAAGSPAREAVTCYRFGSVSQDTNICLWDLTEELLKQSAARHWAREEKQVAAAREGKGGGMSHSNSVTSKDSGLPDNSSSNHSSGASSSGSTDTGKASSTSSLTHKLASLGLGSKGEGRSEHKRTFSLPGRGGGGGKERAKEAREVQAAGAVAGQGATKGLGWPGCPRLADTPMLEPVVTKKIAHERLTALVFREECIVTACQDGYVCTWARPGRGTGTVGDCE